eukprot:CAMPEP_0172778552 /NCGR_PEP_ID=MMETSP1074-20121228/201965_1 /TAXON_ID=2916 /ORGANISM="Ceratium fusus, Strain PA161109" /LENGTH=389 /DNA_ID=CAMNT_0013615491 /DNA_START=87 /DNA_END=1256 /DNA_ORIENTATION=-
MQQQQQKAERGERSRSPRGRTVAVHEVVTPSKPAQPVQEIQTPPKVHHSSTVFAPQAAVPVELQRLKAYVVNLDRRADRWARCEALLQKETPWLEYERFSASDGSKMAIPEEEICTVWNTRKKGNYGDYDEWVYDAPGTERDCVPWRWKGQEPADDDREWSFVVDNDNCDAAMVTNKLTKDTFKVKKVFAERYRNPGQDQKMSGGERGCAHSHRRLWEIVAQRNQPTMILEDDVQFCFEASEPKLGWNDGGVFTERLILALREAPKDWEVLYLGWSGWRGGNYCILEEKCCGKAVRKAEYVWTTVAYIMTPVAARKLLALARPMDQPVDEFMAWEASQGRLKSFVVTSEGDGDDVWAGGIASQTDFLGDSDIPKSDGGMQGDDVTSFAI